MRSKNAQFYLFSPHYAYTLLPVVFYFHATLNSDSFISTLNLTLAFNARKTFKIVSIVTFFVLCSNLEIWDFWTPISSPSCSCVKFRSFRSDFIISPSSSIRRSNSYLSLSGVPISPISLSFSWSRVIIFIFLFFVSIILLFKIFFSNPFGFFDFRFRNFVNFFYGSVG